MVGIPWSLLSGADHPIHPAIHRYSHSVLSLWVDTLNTDKNTMGKSKKSFEKEENIKVGSILYKKYST